MTKRRWGNFKILLKGKGFWVKRLSFNGGSIHYQDHKKRDEMWLIYVPAGCKHQIKGTGDIMEIAIGEVLEKDVKHYKDKI
jgi:mannose-6-phosphate isomerase-like protein (cupin superfamily)